MSIGSTASDALKHHSQTSASCCAALCSCCSCKAWAADSLAASCAWSILELQSSWHAARLIRENESHIKICSTSKAPDQISAGPQAPPMAAKNNLGSGGSRQLTLNSIRCWSWQRWSSLYSLSASFRACWCSAWPWTSSMSGSLHLQQLPVAISSQQRIHELEMPMHQPGTATILGARQHTC